MTGMPAATAFCDGVLERVRVRPETTMPSTFWVTAASMSCACFSGSPLDSRVRRARRRGPSPAVLGALLDDVPERVAVAVRDHRDREVLALRLPTESGPRLRRRRCRRRRPAPRLPGPVRVRARPSAVVASWCVLSSCLRSSGGSDRRRAGGSSHGARWLRWAACRCSYARARRLRRLERRHLGDGHVPPGLRARRVHERVGLDVHDGRPVRRARLAQRRLQLADGVGAAAPPRPGWRRWPRGRPAARRRRGGRSRSR